MSTNMKEFNSCTEGQPTESAIRDRLQEVRLSEYDRLVAEAHLARAEAIADLIARAIEAVRGAARALLSRPWRRIAAAIR